jgi:hypothetical protein
MANQQITIKDKITSLVIGAVAIFLVIGGYSAINFYVSRPELPKVDPVITEEDIKKAKEEIPVDLKKYESYQKVNLYPNGLVTPKDLIRACEDRKRIPVQCDAEITKITRVLVTSGEIQDAYLYIKAGVSRDNAPFGTLTEFDSIWFFVDSSDFGGHLLRSQAIVKRQSDDGVTELLYNLREVPFVGLPYRDDANPRMRNILGERLNTPGEHFVGAFVSTLGLGNILEAKIGYDGGLIEIRK